MTAQTEAQRDAGIRTAKRRMSLLRYAFIVIAVVGASLGLLGFHDLSHLALLVTGLIYGQGRYWHGWLDRAEEVRRDPA